MSSWKYTIAFRKSGVVYKICKVFFGSDGSYYVMSPYHRAGRAILAKVPFEEGREEEKFVGWDDAIEVAIASDDEGRIKLSHHPDGFVQFSGKGLISGKDHENKIRGVGTYSWALDLEDHAFAFGVVLRGVEDFDTLTSVSDEVIVFDVEALPAPSNADVYVLEAHYLPGHIRRFVQKDPSGLLHIWVYHPLGISHPFRVVFPPEECPRQNFFGFHLFAKAADADHPPSSFSLSSAIGNLHRTPKGRTMGEALHCLYPRPQVSIERTLDYVKDREREPTA